jgi:hypothetical protein
MNLASRFFMAVASTLAVAKAIPKVITTVLEELGILDKFARRQI